MSFLPISMTVMTIGLSIMIIGAVGSEFLKNYRPKIHGSFFGGMFIAGVILLITSSIISLFIVLASTSSNKNPQKQGFYFANFSYLPSLLVKEFKESLLYLNPNFFVIFEPSTAIGYE